nr:GYD domain-containing protein [Phytoactinopolyspora endophytica]
MAKTTMSVWNNLAGVRMMPTYISLINWTDQGVRNTKETVERAKAATELAERMGGTLRDVYWTVGEYDIVSIAEFPDDETGTAFLLALGSQGNIRTSTLRAFNSEQMTGILGKLG